MKKFLFLSVFMAMGLLASCSKDNLAEPANEVPESQTEKTVNWGRCPDCGYICTNMYHDRCSVCNVSRRPPSGCICMDTGGGGDKPGGPSCPSCGQSDCPAYGSCEGESGKPMTSTERAAFDKMIADNIDKLTLGRCVKSLPGISSLNYMIWNMTTSDVKFKTPATIYLRTAWSSGSAYLEALLIGEWYRKFQLQMQGNEYYSDYTSVQREFEVAIIKTLYANYRNKRLGLATNTNYFGALAGRPTAFNGIMRHLNNATSDYTRMISSTELEGAFMGYITDYRLAEKPSHPNSSTRPPTFYDFFRHLPYGPAF